jgi:arsenical pump membrane protein
VLVTGLLLVGLVAAEDGLFTAAGAALARSPGGVAVLYGLLLTLVAAVTVVLNLDTAVLFLTPVLVHAARRRGADERAFLYGAVFMSNSASLLLPGSNLTNLLVLSREHVSGATFAARIWPAWVAAILVTTLVVGLAFPLRAGAPRGGELARGRLGLGLAGTLAAAVLVLALQQPALPVLALGVLLVLLRRTPWRDLHDVVSPAHPRVSIRGRRRARDARTFLGLARPLAPQLRSGGNGRDRRGRGGGRQQPFPRLCSFRLTCPRIRDRC